MTSRKILIKNENLWYHSSRKTSYVPDKTASLEYEFRETGWNKGVILDGLVNETTRQITRAPNKTFTDLSLTKTEDDEWGKRKIIHSLQVKIEKNITDEYADVVNYSVVQVKKEMFEQIQPGSFVSDKKYWCSNQLVNSPSENMFSSSIMFTDLAYDLAEGEDFALIQDVSFKKNFLQRGSKTYVPASKPYVNYEIIIVYSDKFF